MTEFQRGAEWMREEAARLAEAEATKLVIGRRGESVTQSLARRDRGIAAKIRALPLSIEEEQS